MHEMHSLLFAALETFSLILLRKTNIQKKETSNHIYLQCESASSAAHRVTVCLICLLHNFRLWIAYVFFISSDRYLKVFS